MKTELRQNTWAILALIIVTYSLTVIDFMFAVPLLVMAPIFLLQFIKLSDKEIKPYVILLCLTVVAIIVFKIVFGKSYRYTAIMTCGFVLIVVLPALLLRGLHSITPDRSVRSEQGEIFFNKMSSKAVAIAPLPAVITVVALMVLFPNLIQSLKDFMVTFIEAFISMANLSDLERLDSNNPLMVMYRNREKLVESALLTAPSSIFMYIAVVTFFTEKLFYKLKNTDIFTLNPNIQWVVVVAGLAIISKNHTLDIVGSNLLFIAFALYFCRGFDVFVYNIMRIRMNPLLRFMLYAIILLSTVARGVVVFIGFVSMYKNLIHREKVEKQH